MSRRPAFVFGLLVLGWLMPSGEASGGSIGFSGTVFAADASGPLLFPPYNTFSRAFRVLGMGDVLQVTSITDVPQLAGVSPSDVVFTFGGLELVSTDIGTPRVVLSYGDVDPNPSFLNLFVNFQPFAEGSSVRVDIVFDPTLTQIYSGYAIATGSALLTGGINGPIGIEVDPFDALTSRNYAYFYITGRLLIPPVPEVAPSALVALGLVSLGIARARGRQPRGGPSRAKTFASSVQ